MSTASLFRGQGYALLASAARTTSSNSGTLTGTSILPCGSAISLLLDVTANSGTQASTTGGLQVYLDTSPDGGTTWFAVEKFAAVLTSTSAQIINFRSTGIGSVEAASSTVIASTTTNTNAVVSNPVLSAVQRIRWTIGNGDQVQTSPSATFSVFAICQPMGSTTR